MRGVGFVPKVVRNGPFPRSGQPYRMSCELGTGNHSRHDKSRMPAVRSYVSPTLMRYRGSVDFCVALLNPARSLYVAASSCVIFHAV